MNWTLGIMGAMAGLIWGSFSSVLIPRWHAQESGIVMGRSHCDACKKPLGATELIPLFSFLFQKGLCKHCKCPIPRWIPIMELISALTLGWISAWHGVTDWEWARAMITGMLLLSISLSDILYQEVHDALPLSGLLILIILQFLDNKLPTALAGALVGASFFGVQWLISKGKGVGTGDVGIGLIMGLFLRWPVIIGALLIAYVSASSFAIIQMARNKATLKSRIPLGPFLALGTMIAWGLHAEILRWIHPSI